LNVMHAYAVPAQIYLTSSAMNNWERKYKYSFFLIIDQLIYSKNALRNLVLFHLIQKNGLIFSCKIVEAFY